MSLEIYKVLHIVGLVLLAIGAGAAASAPKGEKAPRLAMVLHGAGLVLLAVAGFGLMARLGISSPDAWPLWLVLKMVVWLFAAALPVLARKGVVPKGAAWMVTTVLAGTAAYLALVKPFV